MIRLDKWCCVLAIGVIVTPWVHADAQSADGATWANEVKQVVVAQVTGEATLSSAVVHSRFTPWNVELDSLPSTWPGIRLFRARLWASSHRHPYLVALDGSRVYRLGGFAGSDVVALTECSPTDIATAVAALGRAREVVHLLDENGAVDLVFPADSQARTGANGLVARWRRTAPETWPRDTTIRTENALTYEVTLTVLSRSTWGMADAWLPVAYSLSLDEKGALKAWARREGAPVP